jgi:hypothetical protein
MAPLPLVVVGLFWCLWLHWLTTANPAAPDVAEHGMRAWAYPREAGAKTQRPAPQALQKYSAVSLRGVPRGVQ